MYISDVKPGAQTMYSRVYQQFRGVDFSTDSTQVDLSRSPGAVNIISDTKGFPEKRLGWRWLTQFAGTVHALFYAVVGGTGFKFAHIGTKLVTWEEDGTTNEVFDGLAEHRSAHFVHDAMLYVLDGTEYRRFKYDGGTWTEEDVIDVAYVPTVRISITGNEVTQIGTSNEFFGGHTYVEHESPNILTTRRKCLMVGDGASVTYHLPETDIDSVDVIRVNKVKLADTAYTVDLDKGHVTFTTAPAADPDGAGLSNIEVEYTCSPKKREEKEYDADGTQTAFDAYEDSLTVPEVIVDGEVKTAGTDYTVTEGVVTFTTAPASGAQVRIISAVQENEKLAERVRKCTIADTFGYFNNNRFFITGEENVRYQNCDYMTGADDPTYFPYTGWVRVGADSSKIMGYLKQYDAHLIVKEDNDQDAQVFARTAMDDGEQTTFPVKQGIRGVGAIAKDAFAVLRDDPMFFAQEGVFGIVGADVEDQRTIQDRSKLINKRLTAEEHPENACAAVWNSYYLLAINNHCYVADARQMTGESDTEYRGYEWYYWDNIPAKLMMSHDGGLYFFGSEDVETAIPYVSGTEYYPAPAGYLNNGALYVNGNEQTALSWGYSDGQFYLPNDYGDSAEVTVRWQRNGICKFNSDISTMQKYADGAYGDDEGRAIEAVWTTKSDTFDTILNLKSLPKKGCALIIKPFTRSSIEIGYITNREGTQVIRTELADIFDFSDVDFERFTFNTLDLPQVLPIKKKIKKFNIIQFIIRSAGLHEGFGLYGIQLTYLLGRYVK